MAYTSIDDPTLFFNTVLYTGTGSSQSITGVGFQPDWVWVKRRDGTQNHRMVNSATGSSELQSSNLTNIGPDSSYFSSFDSDGFTVGTASDTNVSSGSFVSWNWFGGTSFSNSAGSNGADLSCTGSVNTTSGFSAITATSDNSSNRKIAHGLGAVPDVIWAKNLDSAYNWDIYFKVLGYNDSYRLNTTNAGRSSAWGSTTFTTNFFETGNSYSSASGDTYIYYCFAEKKGFSKFGEFTSIGNNSGVFVPCGFAPRWVLIKPQVSDGWSNWYIFDTVRDHPQLNENPLFANLSTRENYYGGSPASNYDQIDIVSNGFKIRRDSNWGVGGNGQKSIFMAFAESPFVNSSGIPCNAI